MLFSNVSLKKGNSKVDSLSGSLRAEILEAGNLWALFEAKQGDLSCSLIRIIEQKMRSTGADERRIVDLCRLFRAAFLDVCFPFQAVSYFRNEHISVYGFR